MTWRDLKPGTRVTWHGFDGNRYDARVVKVRRRGRVARIDYRHPRTGETISAYVGPFDLARMELQP